MVDERTKQDALFVNLVMLFKEAALQQMGKLINPITGKLEKNLDQARFSIDTLDMLKAKTAGNLSSEIERLLDTTLIELRMNYIAEVESESKKGGESKEDSQRDSVKSDAERASDKDSTNSTTGSEKGDSASAKVIKRKDEEAKVQAKFVSGKDEGIDWGSPNSTLEEENSASEKGEVSKSRSKRKSRKTVGRKTKREN
ncbi:MAG: DUF1844 domain-containing protein [bacterium]